MKDDQKMKIFDYTAFTTIAFLAGFTLGAIYYKPIRFYSEDLNKDGRNDIIFRNGKTISFYLKQPNGDILEISEAPKETRDSLDAKLKNIKLKILK